MADLNLYKPNIGNWCIRIIHVVDNKAVDFRDTTGATLNTTATLVQSSLDLAYVAAAHGFAVVIPSGLAAGEYDLLFYNVAASAMLDSVVCYTSRRFKWNGRGVYSCSPKFIDI